MELNIEKLNEFIAKLTSYSSNVCVDNQYQNKLQISNLKYYLYNMSLVNPNILFVGEAPGYQGCALTGIPFTSEFIIKTHKATNMLQRCIANGEKKEPTATIVWEILGQKEIEGKLVIKPLLWNIFPFHPIKNGCITTNRKPSVKETDIGLEYLYDLLKLFPSIEKIYAVGHSAANKLQYHPKFAGYIRHPSNGGKQKFKEAIDKIYL